MVFFFSQKPQCGAGRGYRVNLRVFFYNYRLCKQYPTQTHTHTDAHTLPLLTEYMALTMREAVDTLPESSSKLWVSLFIVSTLMSGLPSVTPRRPGSKTRRGWMQLDTRLSVSVFSWAEGNKFRGDLHPYGGEEVVGVWFSLVCCPFFGIKWSI